MNSDFSKVKVGDVVVVIEPSRHDGARPQEYLAAVTKVGRLYFTARRCGYTGLELSFIKVSGEEKSDDYPAKRAMWPADRELESQDHLAFIYLKTKGIRLEAYDTRCVLSAPQRIRLAGFVKELLGEPSSDAKGNVL